MTSPHKNGPDLSSLKAITICIILVVLIAIGYTTWREAVNQKPPGSHDACSKITQQAANGNEKDQMSIDCIANLDDPHKKDIAMQLVSAAENSSLDWKAQYAYIEYDVEGNAAENRGYTGGLVGFTSSTGDMLSLIKYYRQLSPGNVLEKYLPALESALGSASMIGLGDAFVSDWQSAATTDFKFRVAQDHERDLLYFSPAIALATSDKLHALGQFIYYDAAVMHGINGKNGLLDIREKAQQQAKPPSRGGDEFTYLQTFLDARKAAMLTEASHSDTSRVDTAQRKFLKEGNLSLSPPLSFRIYGDEYTVK